MVWVQIADMKDLTTLHMNSCEVTNSGLHQILEQCPLLTHMRADGCPISMLGMWSAIRKRPDMTFWNHSKLTNC